MTTANTNTADTDTDGDSNNQGNSQGNNQGNSHRKNDAVEGLRRARRKVAAAAGSPNSPNSPLENPALQHRITLPPQAEISHHVSLALHEDLAETGDITARLVAQTGHARAHIISREAAVLCGQPWADEALRQAAPGCTVRWLVAEGAQVRPDEEIAQLEGAASELLQVERTMLNYLQLLSGVATVTAQYVAAAETAENDNRTRIVDTRKTLPGLRNAQKYAVATGGGVNHRYGLYDAMLIKENHIMAAGGVREVLELVEKSPHRPMFTEIEVENLEQMQEALQAGAVMLLLDNMSTEQLRQAVAMRDRHHQDTGGYVVLEVSGNVTLERVPQLAAVGVDRISAGALTKHVTAVDLSMRFYEQSDANSRHSHEKPRPNLSKEKPNE